MSVPDRSHRPLRPAEADAEAAGEVKSAAPAASAARVARSLQGRIDAIVIGASAGGIEALSMLLPALPPNLAASVFVVLHLPRERPSLLVEIFSTRCALTVRDADDKEPVRPGTVYFAPNDYHLLVDRIQQPWLAAPSSTGSTAASAASVVDNELPRWQIALSFDAPVHYSRPSIDVLFQSAAEAYRDRLLAIVLTGANQDGAEGLAAVHAAGGITVVQSPGDAQVSTMPSAAIARVKPDHVLPLIGIAALLRTLGGASPANVAPHNGIATA